VLISSPRALVTLVSFNPCKKEGLGLPPRAGKQDGYGMDMPGTECP
jgi:hypothetical protein